MNRCFRTTLCSLLALLATAIALPASAAPTPGAPQLASTGYILMDFDSGYVLAESNADERLEPASLTKIMTAYAVFTELQGGRLTLEEQATISEKAWRTGGSRMFLEPNTKVSIEQLLKGMIIQSGNDAAVALAEYVAGTEDGFVHLMNEHATRLGLKGTVFVNATGLADGDAGERNYTTARDMALLTAALIRDFPEYYSWYSIKEYTYNGIHQFNRNKLLWRDERVDGVKTGHTESAGYCLVSSGIQDGMRLISVVMGTASEDARAQESQKLLHYGFRFFETHRLYEAGTALRTVEVWKGEEEEVRLGIAKPLYITIPRGRYGDLNASLLVPNDIIAPVRKGSGYGTVQVKLDGQLVASVPLTALEDIPEGGLWTRMVDEVLLWFE